MSQTVKKLLAMQETWVQSLGLEDPLERRMATYSSILAWRIPWTEEPDGLQSIGSQRVDTTERITQTEIYYKLLITSFKMILFLFFLHLIKYSQRNV